MVEEALTSVACGGEIGVFIYPEFFTLSGVFESFIPVNMKKFPFIQFVLHWENKEISYNLADTG